MHYAIIAAGEGSRLVGEGLNVPKPLVDLDGRPMIKRLIDIMMECGAESLSVIVNEQMTEVREYLEGLRLPVPFHIVVKSTPSSMHSFYEVSRVFSAGAAKFVLTTVDTIFRPEDFRAYVNAFESSAQIDGLMGVTDYIEDEKPLYVEVDEADMNILGFKDADYPGSKYISAGIYGLTPKGISVLGQCLEAGVSRMRNYQRALISAGLRLEAFAFGKVIDVDHLSDIQRAKELLK
ncbi:MAG: NTP transferase domain-containing protein [Muribaculaceae bacterium]|nr:NTP transferase domain-containing protein [Muribaculaceae bacterium]